MSDDHDHDINHDNDQYVAHSLEALLSDDHDHDIDHDNDQAADKGAERVRELPSGSRCSLSSPTKQVAANLC